MIFQCSEGIPRQINNLCDNAMLTAYAAGRANHRAPMIEEVADNLDLLPRKDALSANEKAVENVGSARVLTNAAREELWNNQARMEKPKPMFKTEPLPANRNSNVNGNGNSNANQSPFDDLDDDISLEIEEVGGFY